MDILNFYPFLAGNPSRKFRKFRGLTLVPILGIERNLHYIGEGPGKKCMGEVNQSLRNALFREHLLCGSACCRPQACE